ncbi:sortase family protein [Kribbella flavida DSM 17836]|uniref:Sortase family protein n=1 Tax=Kribbella flavida (strain DSM 17836 / JCM 10339 / NBRC 14399) TaxID=479435 RepID=D2PQX2_KRIFD|nr:class E sortase [Kribbella flavida]ADB31105.1 sortase family protein [Kribbella flavida DSM 17836]
MALLNRWISQPWRVLGVLFLVAGLSVLGWVGWQYFGTGITANRTMDRLEHDLRAEWASGPRRSGASPGTPITLLRIPRFGADWEKPVVEGVGEDELARGLGHYPQTQLPGEPGNFAIAGHRVTHGSPFRKLLELRKGDQVIVETADAVYTYELNGAPRDLTVKPADTWVLDPVPGKPGQTPTKPILTLTTCQDLFHSPDRSVAFAHLVSQQPKTSG